MPFGKFSEQVSKFCFFCGFPTTYRFQNFGFFPWFSAIFRGPKKSQNADFSAVSRDFEGRARPKILRSFPAMNRAQNLDFPAVSHNFYGTQKIFETRFSPRFLGISKDGLVQNFSELGLPRSFLGILKCWTHPKK